MLSPARLTVPAYALHKSRLAGLTFPSRSGALCRRAWATTAGAGKTSSKEVPHPHVCAHIAADRSGSLQASNSLSLLDAG